MSEDWYYSDDMWDAYYRRCERDMETQNGTRGIPYNYLDGAMGEYTDREKAARDLRQQQEQQERQLRIKPSAQAEELHVRQVCVRPSAPDPGLPSDRQIRLHRERIAGPPPRREQAKYGPRGHIPGDNEFQRDRARWYENFTGRSIAEVSLQEQNDLCDVIARFRECTDSRATTV